MTRKSDPRRSSVQWIECLAWNGAAVAVLLAMIWMLLGTLSWLDRISPPVSPGDERAAQARDPAPSRVSERRARSPRPQPEPVLGPSG
jgi:hypothetical protein